MSLLAEYGYLVILAILLAVVLYRLVWSPPERQDNYEAPWQTEENTRVLMLKADLPDPNIHHKVGIEDLASQWRESMAEYGQQMKVCGVEQVFFVNGTYAGFDPVDLINLAENLFPKLPKKFVSMFRSLNVAGLNSLVKDTGNFLDRYVTLFSLGCQMQRCENFKWSSANHHAARLEGAIQFLSNLAEKVRQGQITPDARVLVIGHSHAGQVFSLMSQLLYSPDPKPLREIVYEYFLDKSLFENIFKKTKSLRFDFVTLGMPPRYRFIEHPNCRLLHLINHRGSTHEAGSLKGIFHTKDGDYVQQLGIRGTDNAAFVPKLRMANQKLNAILDGGVNVKRWVADIKLKNRVPKYGTSCLIDYGDQSFARPNMFRTIFGHGTYTETRFMEFNTRTIVNQFYRS